jgi:hypothetical protein
MTADHFEEWLDKLLPNILPNSVIVMDNASYHSHHSELIPIKIWTKKKKQEWFDGKGIQYSPHALKTKLYSIIQQEKPTRRYDVDEW